MRAAGWVIKDYVRRTLNIAGHIPEELKGFEEYFERCGEYIVIYIPRVIYNGNDEELAGKTERLLPDFLLPYCRYPLEDIQSVLDPDEEKPQTTADERTIVHWREIGKKSFSEIKRKAGEMERIGIKINKLPDETAAAVREIKKRLGSRWFGSCYVMAFLTKPSKWTNLKNPPNVSLENLLCEVTSNHEENKDTERTGET